MFVTKPKKVHSVAEVLRLSIHFFVYFNFLERMFEIEVIIIASACIACCLFFDCVTVQNDQTIKTLVRPLTYTIETRLNCFVAYGRFYRTSFIASEI